MSLSQPPITRSAPRAFYVTIRHGARTIYALGPFRTHRRALGLVDALRLTVSRAELDLSNEYGYGTASAPAQSSAPLGALNAVLGVGPCVGMRHGRAQRMPAAAVARLSSARGPYRTANRTHV